MRPPSTVTATPSSGGSFRSEHSSSTAPTRALPEGVIAEAQGIRGLIRVEQTPTHRLLTMTDDKHGRVVHASQRYGDARPAMVSDEDELVALIRHNTSPGDDVLVVGLGSGKFARDLATAGMKVSVAELEPAVIDFARRYFGYRGHAVAADGLDYLSRHDKHYSVVVIDAFEGTQLSGDFYSKAAVEIIKRRCRLLIIRLLARPSSSAFTSLVELYGDPSSVALASGTEDEEQTIYLLTNCDIIVDGRSANLQPILLPSRLMDPVLDDRDGIPRGRSRKVRLVGYLAMTENGLSLELPLDTMGCRRYLLHGAATAPLTKIAPPVLEALWAKIRPPDLSYLLGGDLPLGSDLRRSPIAVAIEGRARFRAAYPPMGTTPVPEISSGGVLYDVTVEKVLWTISLWDWQQLYRTQLAAPIAEAIKAIEACQLEAAAVALDRYQRRVRLKFGDLVKQMLAPAQVIRLADTLAAAVDELAAQDHPPDDFQLAVAFDRAQHGNRDGPLGLHGIDTIGYSLRICAIRHYDLIYRDRSHPSRDLAAARMLYLGRTDLGEAGELKPLEEPPTL